MGRSVKLVAVVVLLLLLLLLLLLVVVVLSLLQLRAAVCWSSVQLLRVSRIGRCLAAVIAF
jgi:hypothetical protein